MKKLNIGIIKGFSFLFILSCGFMCMYAADLEEIKVKMLEIKLNEDYIFGEGISDNKELAYGIALDDLLAFVNEMKNENSQEGFSMKDLITKVESLVYNDGNRYEVVVYIPFKIIFETSLESSFTKNDIIKIGSEKKESFAKNENTVNKPKVNEGIELENSYNAHDNEFPNNSYENSPTEATNGSNGHLSYSNQPDNTSATLVTVSNPDIIENGGEIEEFLLTQENFTEIKSFLSKMKSTGKIYETGVTDSIADIPSDANLIILDELGGILSLLSPATEKGRINYKTNQQDKVNNYNCKFIVWYRK